MLLVIPCSEKKKRAQELSVLLGRMRELVWLLKADPEPEQYIVVLRELAQLFSEAERLLAEVLADA